MNIIEGFQIEKPEVFIPWKIHEADLEHLFGDHSLRRITRGYYGTSCLSLSGLSHELGFHFYPRRGGVLVKLEFFRLDYFDQAASYREFQKHLETTFGQPTSSSPGTVGFPSHTWSLHQIRIVHYIFERFGPEEHVHIERTDLIISPLCSRT